jgi:hypothetical protein
MKISRLEKIFYPEERILHPILETGDNIIIEAADLILEIQHCQGGISIQNISNGLVELGREHIEEIRIEDEKDVFIPNKTFKPNRG